MGKGVRPADLERFLYSQIPLSKALGIHVAVASRDRVELHSPLGPNRNHMGTVFGGSLAAVAILASYTWIFNLLEERGNHVHIILKSSETKYLSPVENDFVAICQAPEQSEIESFLKAFDKKGLARLNLISLIQADGKTLCSLNGEFAAKKS